MKSNVIGIIYKHTNKMNGRSYVGQTIQWKNPERRWRHSDITYRSYENCSVFFKALNKYGWDGFTTEILFFAYSQEALNKAEEYFINLYNCLAPNGYNTEYFVQGVGKRHELVGEKIRQKKLKYYSNPENRIAPVNKKSHKLINNIEHKHCSDCNTWHPLSNFRSNKNRWDKLTGSCKECLNNNQYKKDSKFFLRHELNGELVFLSLNPEYKKHNGPIPK